MKKRKILIERIILFLILAALVIFAFWFLKDKNADPKPNDPDHGEKPNNPDEENTPPDPEGTSYLNNIKYTATLDKDIEQVIIEYMDVYYKSMKDLKEYDMTYLFSNPIGDQALINQTALSLLVDIRTLKPNDLSLSSAKYDLDIKKVTTEGDITKVVVRENNYLHFNFMKEIESKVYNIENTFKIVKKDGKYKISSYDKVQDFFVMITDKYKTGGKSSLDKIKNDYLTIIKKNVENDKRNYDLFLKGEGINRKTCGGSYDRDKALEYAKKWVNKRNSDWVTFDSNCQNYASQMLYVGGIPMDHEGDASKYLQWKFYDSSYNESQVNKGYVYTWTSVTRFYQYAKNNTGTGLCADVDVNSYYAEAGDIIQVGTDGPTRHTLVSIGPYKKDDKVVDILVNSNTVDLENFPLSAYVYPYTSLIKIYGYN